MIKRTVMALIMVLMLFVLSACTVPLPFERGEVLSAEEVEARRAALLAEKEANENKPHDGICYWLVKGSVYHVFPDCTYIAGKENVQSGTQAEAQAAGKERACAVCSKRNAKGEE